DGIRDKLVTGVQTCALPISLYASADASNSIAYTVFYNSHIYLTAASTATATAVPFVAGEWYHVELRNIDWTNHRFDYYIDGNLRSEERRVGKGWRCGGLVSR